MIPPRNPFLRSWVALLIGMISWQFSWSQTTGGKEVRHYSDFWSGYNFSLRTSPHWGVIAEGELRRKEFLAQPNVYYLCAGLQYHFQKGLNAHAAIGRQWAMYEAHASWLSTSETRVQVQVVYQQKSGRFKFRERLRNEFRWIDRAPEDPSPGKEFHDRVRLQVGAEMRLFHNDKLPSLYVYNEYLTETISGFTHPSFDQNRIFVGIRQPVTPSFNIDVGYLNAYAKSGSPPVQEMHDVLRIVLYWSPDPFKKHDSKRKVVEEKQEVN
jgi:Protein of unknown function (DUF2490)